ncbi:MAG: EAL domain-containing protein [Halofilum sp. (in: g-proteobacteria)]|nr:EAL domain-containing protein [Halofilum sp. (in: g-proteobacteria)]
MHAAGRRPIEGRERFPVDFLPTGIYRPARCLRTTVEALRGTGRDPDQVIFEVVETGAVEEREHLRTILGYYRDNGFGVALDDLAAGYSGLALRAGLDPDRVRIDREIVGRAPESEGHADVCRAVIDCAHERGREVLAEGIETEAQRAS